MYLHLTNMRNNCLSGCFTSHLLQQQNQLQKPGLLLFHHTSLLPPQQYPQGCLWAPQEAGLQEGSDDPGEVKYSGVGVAMGDKQKRNMRGEGLPQMILSL